MDIRDTWTLPGSLILLDFSSHLRTKWLMVQKFFPLPPSTFYRESRWLVWIFICRHLAWGGIHPFLPCKLKVWEIMVDICKKMSPQTWVISWVFWLVSWVLFSCFVFMLDSFADWIHNTHLEMQIHSLLAVTPFSQRSSNVILHLLMQTRLGRQAKCGQNLIWQNSNTCHWLLWLYLCLRLKLEAMLDAGFQLITLKLFRIFFSQLEIPPKVVGHR